MKEVKIDVVIETANSARSINDLKKSIKELDDAAGDLEIGSEQFEALNKKSKELKDTLGGLGKQSNETGGFLGGLGDKVGGLPGPLGQATSGVAGLGKQFLLLLANPIVLVIAAITGAIVLLYKSFTKTEEGGNKVNKVFTVLNGVFSGFLKAIKPIADFIVDNVVKAFKQLGEILTVVGDGVAKFVGFFSADAEKKLRNFANAIEANVQASLRLAKAEEDLVKANRESRKTQLLAQIEAEKLRQIRDDESKSVKERIEANKELGGVLNKQLNDELALANKALEVAKAKKTLDGETTEVLDALAEAETNLIDIRERITGQQSEQLANENALRKEAAAAAAERKKAAAERLKAEQDAAKAIADAEAKAKADSINTIIELENEGEDAKLSAQEREINAVYDKYFAQIEAAKQYGLEITTLEEGQAAAILEINKKYAEEKAKVDEEKADKEKEESQKALDLKRAETDAALGMASMATGAIIANMEEGSEAGKSLAVAQTTIDTWRGAQAAYASAQANPLSILGPAYPTIMAGIAVAFGLANVRKILSTKKPTKGSAPSTPSAGSSAPAAPTINPQTLFSTQQLQGAETEQVSSGGIGQRQQVIKAVVSERDVTAVQNRISNYEQRSEIG